MHEKTYEKAENKPACDRKPLASAAIATERVKILSRSDCCFCGSEAEYKPAEGLYPVDTYALECCNIDCPASATVDVTAEQVLK